jgi:hypothetical protein
MLITDVAMYLRIDVKVLDTVLDAGESFGDC